MDTYDNDTTEPAEVLERETDDSADCRDPFAVGEVAEPKAQQDKRGQRFEEVLCEAIAEMIAKGMTV